MDRCTPASGNWLHRRFKTWVHNHKGLPLGRSVPKCFDEQRESRRGLAAGQVVEVVAGQRWAPVFEDGDQGAGLDVALHHVPGHIAQPKPGQSGDIVRRKAAEKGATPAQVSLAWLLAQRPFIVPIPGTRNPDHLAENHGGRNVDLTADDLREMEAAFAPLTVHGESMGAGNMALVER